MPGNEESPPRVRKSKGHRDPFDALLGVASAPTRKGDEDDETPPEDPGDEDDGGGDGPAPVDPERPDDDEPAPISPDEPVDPDDVPEEPGEDEDEDPDARPPMVDHSMSSSVENGDDEGDYTDLLMEEGTEEIGIRSENGMEATEGENEANENNALPVSNARTLARDAIKQNLVLKSRAQAGAEPSNAMKLDLLEMPGKKALFIGRKRSVMQKSGLDGALYVGKIQDEEKFREHKLYLDSLNPHVVFVCGARGSGKCLTGDTLITLENGKVVPIQELDRVSGNVFGLQHDLKIESLPREGFYKRKVQEILKIRFRSGKEIKLTPEHPLLTLEGWKPAQELKISSRIAAPRSLPSFGLMDARDCEIKLLAYFIAEGHLGNHFTLFSNEDPCIQEEFSHCISEFHPNLQIKIHGKPGCFRVVQKKKQVDMSAIVRNAEGKFTPEGYILHKKNPIMEWMGAHGLYNMKSVHKFIPEIYLQLPKEKMAILLNRLFSCDGTIYRVNKGKNWCIGYASSSEKLIRQIQHLVLRFGILSTLRSKTVTTNGKKFPVFELVLYGENVLRFITQIGFFGAKAEKASRAEDEMMGLSRNPNTDTIPKEVWNRFSVPNWAQLGRDLGYSSPKSLIHAQSYSPSREKLLKMAHVQGNKGIQLLAQSDIFWDEIVEKTTLNGEFDVYDISVPTHHNFVANDIIVHNSYVLGVLAEELALQNPNVGVVVVDPVGVFWSMKFPNKEEKEVKELPHFDLMPQGLENMRVFIPEGMKTETPKSTYDSLFSIPPALLTSEDWCLTFGIDRFSPTGLLMEKSLKKVERGYRNTNGETIKGKKTAYSLNELIACLETDAELHSKEKGYKPDSIRALVSRFEAAKSWGIFSEKGTPLGEISRPNQLTVIDTSFLDDTVTALVIGILARRLLAARKMQTRKEAANDSKERSVESLLENEIPPTWLFIDEAHTLIPSGNISTPATSAIVEYVKQGRRPGCSLVFATQQPSAIDTRVLSQLDVIMSHKLIFDDDIKAVTKRTPTIIPLRYKHPHFLKTLPVGTALVGDRREETNRAFVLKIRPRMSQHEGRDAETGEHRKSLSAEEIQRLAVELLLGKLEKEGTLEKETVDQVVHTLNQKYKGKMLLSSVLDELESRGAAINPKDASVRWPPYFTEMESHAEQLNLSPEKTMETSKAAEAKVDALTKLVQPPRAEEDTGLRAFPIALTREQIVDSLLKASRKRLFGLGKPVEKLQEISLSYVPIWKVEYRQFTGKTSYVVRECFVDAEKGEFLHYLNKKFVSSSGLEAVSGLNETEMRVLRTLFQKGSETIPALVKRTALPEKTVKHALVKLYEGQLVQVKNEEKNPTFSLGKNLDIPFIGNEKELGSVQALKLVNVSNIRKGEPRLSDDKLHALLGTLWPNVSVNRIAEIYRPVFEATLLNTKSGEHRMVRLDGFTGALFEE